MLFSFKSLTYNEKLQLSTLDFIEFLLTHLNRTYMKFPFINQHPFYRWSICLSMKMDSNPSISASTYIHLPYQSIGLTRKNLAFICRPEVGGST